jgi:hypothetical protein
VRVSASLRIAHLPYIVLAVFVLAVLGHACLADAHAHGDAHGAQGGGLGADHAHGPHAASCQAIPAVVPTVVPAATTGPVVAIVPAPPEVAEDTTAGRRAPAAPLFLLHASLLI